MFVTGRSGGFTVNAPRHARLRRGRGSSASDRIAVAVLALAGFAVAFWLFSQVTPVYLFDTDDWRYNSYERPPVPIWGGWNPTRVLPEVLMPLCGLVAARLVYPATGDYVQSVMLVDAFAIAAFTAAYLAAFYVLARRRCGAGPVGAASLGLLFLALHFAVLGPVAGRFDHLLFSQSVVTYFYYVIPNLLNASLVMLHLAGSWDPVSGRGAAARRALLAVAVYFALLSNLYASAILGAYMGAVLLCRAARCARRGGGADLRSLAVPAVVLLAWLAVQVFEANGGRAASLAGGSFLERLQGALMALASWGGRVNVPVWCALVALAAAGAAKGARSRRAGRDAPPAGAVPLLLAAGALVAAYLVLVCSRSYASHIARSDVAFGVFFYALLSMMLLVSRLFAGRGEPVAVALAILAACTVPAVYAASGAELRWPNKSGSTAEAARRVDDDIIRQVRAAADGGSGAVEVLVPKYGSGDNWPLAAYGGPFVAETLVKHGVVDGDIQVILVPSEDKNKELL